MTESAETSLPPLRVLAVAPPHHRTRESFRDELTAPNPTSLQSIFLYAGRHLLDETPADEQDAASYWRKSNLAVGNDTAARRNRAEKTLLMNTMEEMDAFEEMLRKERPNLLLLGAMSLNYRGAVECAKKAREILGDEVVIVLGGKHANESFTVDEGGLTLTHHGSSPLKHMQERREELAYTPKNGAEGAEKEYRCFDLVVSGAGEDMVAHLGELVGGMTERGVPLTQFPEEFRKMAHDLPEQEDTPHIAGDWAASLLKPDGAIEDFTSPYHWATAKARKAHEIKPDSTPSVVRLFGTKDFGFGDVFGEDSVTVDVMSRTGRGCVMDCVFCSEGIHIAGKPVGMQTAADRIYQELKDVAEVVAADHPGKKPTAFCNDSIFLLGDPKQLDALADKLEQDNPGVEFGFQMTFDKFFANKPQLERLSKLGAKYIYFGLETLDPKLTTSTAMSKNRPTKHTPDQAKEVWVNKAEQALHEAHQMGYQLGVSLIFGIGETPLARKATFDFIKQFNETHNGAISTVSKNVGTLHPNSDPQEAFLDWGDQPYPGGKSVEGDIVAKPAKALRFFTEASHRYPFSPKDRLNLMEMLKIHHMHEDLKAQGTGRAAFAL